MQAIIRLESVAAASAGETKLGDFRRTVWRNRELLHHHPDRTKVSETAQREGNNRHGFCIESASCLQIG